MSVPNIVASPLVTAAQIRPAVIDRGLAKGKETRKAFHVTGSDGSEWFVCADCQHRSDALWGVMTHRRKHTPPKTDGKPGRPARASSVEELTERAVTALRAAVEAGLSAAPDVTALAAERDDWKRRAKDAERKLATMRRALGVDEERRA